MPLARYIIRNKFSVLNNKFLKDLRIKINTANELVARFDFLKLLNINFFSRITVSAIRAVFIAGSI